MDLRIVIPAAAAASREGFALAATQVRDARSERLLLHASGGGTLLTLAPKDGEFIFEYGRVTVEHADPNEGRAFVDAVAKWLGLELEGVEASEPADAPLDASWVRLGRGEDPFGGEWTTYKLFFKHGERYAEVFARVSGDGVRAELVEKWSRYRRDLVAILERALSGGTPRRIRQREDPIRGPNGEMLLNVQSAFEIAIPAGWRASERPEGHWRIEDPDEEMMIELSYLRLPPLPSEFPSVAERLAVVIKGGEYAGATPIACFRRDDVDFAWSEHRFDSKDTKRPEATPRPARGRTLIGSNEWVQVLVTGCWWAADVTVAEQAWDGVMASLRIAGRVVPTPPAGGHA